jgi:hypothetical protein
MSPKSPISSRKGYVLVLELFTLRRRAMLLLLFRRDRLNDTNQEPEKMETLNELEFAPIIRAFHCSL